MDKYLPVDYELHLNDRPGKYIITDIIGKGASTVAYGADYYGVGENCSRHIIKEFNPSYISFEREENGALKFKTCDENRVADAKERFLSGCDNQIKIRNQTATMNQTPPVKGPFYSNNTIYTDVIAYNGTTYDIAYKNLSLCDRMKVCLSVAKLVKCYHDAGYLYLDIKPKNIFVIPETKELLYFIDFDSVCKKEEIVFGNSISYTKQWAAPEQLNPYAKDEISEATDIYAIGELVFWSVFERHSTMEEHRGFSVYPYEELRCQVRRQVSNILTDLFHNTLRSSVSNRFSMNETIDLINNVIEELSKKEYIIESVIRPNDFFIGRDKELDELDRRLKEEHLIFLYGIGGIGKSEIAKQYALLSAHHRYNNILYWAFSGDFESTICQDSNILIYNMSRVKDESDQSYCRRKLRALKSCLQGNNLIIIDNMNCRLEDIPNQEVWKDLRSLPCDIVVTTRSEQLEHVLPVSEITEFNALREIFTHNCKYDNIGNSQDEYIDEIICCLNGHTLLVELIAKQTYAAGRSPKETLELLKNHGINGTGKETVGMIKDGDITRETVPNHIKKVFSMSTMSFEQQLLLTKAAFLPELGVSLNDFCVYYRLEDKNNVNWLIENGWIYRSSDSDSVLTVHPVISEVVAEELKDNLKLQDSFYSDVNEAFIWESKTIKQIVHAQISASIAAKTKEFKIATRSSAICLIKYADFFSSYGNPKNNFEQIDYAISILKNNISKQKYSAVLENAYLTYIPYVKTQRSLDDAIDLCRTHLSNVKKVKDMYLIYKYCSSLSSLLMTKYEYTESLKELYAAVFYVFLSIYYIANIDRDLNRRRSKYTSSDHLLNDLDYDYLEKEKYNFYMSFYLDNAVFIEKFNSDVLFCTKPSKHELKSLQRAIKMRLCIFQNRNTDNSIEILIDYARILYLEQKYDEAQQRLIQIVNMFKHENWASTMSLYRVHQFLGNIAATTGDYETAVAELKLCLKISRELQLQDDYSVNVQLGRFLNENGDIEASEEHNTKVKKVVEQLDIYSRKSFFGDTLYNLATLHKLKGKSDVALETYVKAINEYESCNARIWVKKIGKARCYRKMYEIYQKLELVNDAKTTFNQAKHYYLSCLAENHPEVVEFLSTASKTDIIK